MKNRLPGACSWNRSFALSFEHRISLMNRLFRGRFPLVLILISQGAESFVALRSQEHVGKLRISRIPCLFSRELSAYRFDNWSK